MPTILGASRKQAGLYYDKGGAVFNVVHPDFGAKGDGTTDDTAAIQAALTAAAGLVPVVIPRTSSYYKITAALNVPSDSYVQVDGMLKMGTHLDYMFTATSQSNIHIYGKGKIKGTNVVNGPVTEERLFWFITCDDITLRGIELSETTIGAQFQGCTKWDFDCRVKDILARSDGSEGYGILANLENSDWRIAGRYYNIGRHAIYTGAGASNGVVDDVVVDGCVNTAVTCNCFNTQTRMKNITYGNIVLRNVGSAGLSGQCSGISIFGNVENVQISSGVVMDTVGGDGIRIEGTSTYLPTTNPQSITIDSPSINTAGFSGIVVVNSSDVTMVKPRIRNAATTGIIVTVTGTGTGSLTDSVDIGSYDINGAATGITVSGDALTTRVSLGWGQMKNVSGSKFNIPSTNTTVRYVGPSTTFHFTEATLAASQTDNPFVANTSTAYWTAPEAGYLTQLWGRLTGGFTAGTLTIRISKNGVGSNTLKVDLAIAQLAYVANIPIGAFAVAAGDLIGVMYTTDASYTPARDAIAQVRFVPFPAA